MSKVFKFFLNLIVTATLLGGLVFVFRARLQNLWKQVQNQYFPCAQPIAYSLGSFDKRFGLSEKDFLSALTSAEQVWEKPIGKDLFTYTTDGSLKINLIYDTRQEATIKLQEIDLDVKDDKASYDKVKTKYDALQVLYTRDKAVLTAKIAAFETKRKKYESEVAYWNSHGGADKQTRASLEKERVALNAMIDEINKLQDTINNQVGQINALATVLNRLAHSLNLSTATYNQVGQELFGEFAEGEYRNSEEGDEINIYQFDDQTKLIRVLAHELGHALGLEHVEDPKAIMYRLNNGVNEKITESDLVILKTRCQVQ